MTQLRMTSDMYRRKVMSLRMSMNGVADARQSAINRAVVETLRSPVVAREVARGLRLHLLEQR